VDFLTLPWSLDKHVSSWIHLFYRTNTLPPLSLSLHYIFILLSLETLPHSWGCGWGWVDSTRGERNQADLCAGHEGQLLVRPPARRKWRELHWKQSISLQGQKFEADFEKLSGLQMQTQNDLSFPRSLTQQIEKSVCTLSKGIKEAPTLFTETLAYDTFGWTSRSSITLIDPSSILNL